MNKGLLMAVVLMVPMSSQAISLEECRQMAHDNYPAIKQYRMIEQSCDFTLDNVAKGWLPQVSASAGVYSFTDIVKQQERMSQMGINMENFMANASVIVRQNVYDGGKIVAQKRIAFAQSEVQKQQLDVSMYAVNERVDQLYFGILLLDEQLMQNSLLQNDLSMSEENIRSMMKGGVANQSDLEAILVEKVKAKQQKETLETSKKTYLRMLGIFLGKDVGENETLEKPGAETGRLLSSGNYAGDCNSVNRKVNRPELSLYVSQNKLLDAQRKQLDANLHPMVSIFGMGMLHSKVTNVLNNGLFMGGLTVSWNIGALYTRKSDLKKLELQRQMNDSQQEIFLFNNRLQNTETEGAISSLRKQLAQDDEIVSLRESIRSKSDKKVLLGTESVNELVRDINAVSMARAQRAQHEIQLLKEIYKQKYINNEYKTDNNGLGAWSNDSCIMRR